MDDIDNIIITKEMEILLRRQKHDFVNHIQVVHAYLQVGKPEKAQRYLDGIVAQINAGTFCSEYSCDGADSVKNE